MRSAFFVSVLLSALVQAEEFPLLGGCRRFGFPLRQRRRRSEPFSLGAERWNHHPLHSCPRIPASYRGKKPGAWWPRDKGCGGKRSRLKREAQAEVEISTGGGDELRLAIVHIAEGGIATIREVVDPELSGEARKS